MKSNKLQQARLNNARKDYERYKRFKSGYQLDKIIEAFNDPKGEYRL